MDHSPIALYYDVLCDLLPHLPGEVAKYLPSPVEVSTLKVEGPLSVSQFSALALLKSIVKKYEDCEDEEKVGADKAALEKFLLCNESCKMWINPLLRDDLWSWEEEALGEVKNFLWRLLNPVSGDEESGFASFSALGLTDILSGIDVGPGAAQLATGDSFYQKLFDSKLTATNQLLYTYYLAAVDRNPLWTLAECQRILQHGTVDVVSGSILNFAPKTPLISRVIATEPSLNMMFQKGIDAILREQLTRQWGIYLPHQEQKNARLAELGSISGSFGTIDLESASDTVAMECVRWLLPPEATRALILARSPEIRLPDGAEVPLHMISSMGNGFTFSLETAIFTAVVLAAYKMLELPILYPRGRAVGNFGVYGDDIVVRAESYSLVCRLLNLLGFTVNASKSFNTGTFRESCGHDWLNGQSVRGVYCKHLRRITDRYSLINRLNRWSARHGIPLPNTLRGLLRSVDTRFIVPEWESDDAGIHVPYSFLRALSSRKGALVAERGGNLPAFVYKKYVQKGPVIRLSTEEEQLEAIFSGRLSFGPVNPYGLQLAASAGYLKGGRISERSLRNGLEVVVKAVAPGWDYAIPTTVGWARVCASDRLLRDQTLTRAALDRAAWQNLTTLL